MGGSPDPLKVRSAHPLTLSHPPGASSGHSDPGVDAARPVQQWALVPRPLEGLNEEEEPKPAEQLAEDGRCHDHEGRHHHKPQNDEGGAAVVVKVTADGGRGIEDLQKQNDRHRGVTLQRM